MRLKLSDESFEIFSLSHPIQNFRIIIPLAYLVFTFSSLQDSTFFSGIIDGVYPIVILCIEA